MDKFNSSSEIKLKGVHPDLVSVIRRAYGYTPKGPDWGIVQGNRTQAQQNALYAQGRTKPGKIVTWTRNSRHIGGYAVDVVHLVDHQFEWKNIAMYRGIAADIKQAGKELGVAVKWGPDIGITTDFGHYQLDIVKYPPGSNKSYLKPVVVPIIVPKAEAKMPTEWPVAPAIKTYMKNIETFQPVAYWDGNGYAIGYGHNAASGIPPFPVKGSTITKEEADKLFEQDLEEMAAKYVRKFVKVPLYQWEFGALVSWIYNSGVGAAIHFDVFNKMNQGKDAEVADIIIKDVPPMGTKYHNGLMKRRLVEYNYFLGKGLI